MSKQSKNEVLLVLTDVMNVLVSNDGTKGEYAIFEENVPPLGGPPPHTHPDEEIFYIVKGDFEFVLNDLQNPFKAKAGSVVHIPSNAVHTFKNVGSAPGKMVVILSPGNLLNYFRVIGKTLTEDSEIPDLTKVPDTSKLDITGAFEHAAAHRVKFILPEIMDAK
ncbi:cupin domain-containing protein [Saccharicrinis sp. FJH62]|uniref:cupin domain-containing protein n=1 Tax=Saccharicrinis sp. FJH62 TaxID=3344657 RepID=UPI0035D3FC29